MVLLPCLGCRRHVAADEPRCRFCGASARGEQRAIKVISEWSRAAIFAGGALVAPACGSHTPQPKPGATEMKPGPTDAKPATGRIVGKATGSRTGAPIREAISFFDAADKSYVAVPDANGAFVLEVPPGTYRTFRPIPHRGRFADAEITTVVKAGETVTVNLSFSEPDPIPPNMPYGAPPARRRIV